MFLIKVQLKLLMVKVLCGINCLASLLYSWTQSQKHKYILSCGKQENLSILFSLEQKEKENEV